MEKGLKELEAQRKEIYRQIEALGDFRPGTISMNYRRCGKKNCTCHQKGHRGGLLFTQNRGSCHVGKSAWQLFEFKVAMHFLFR